MKHKNQEATIAAVADAQKAAESAMSAVIAYLKAASTPTSEEAHNIIDTTLADLGYTSPERHIVAGGTKSHEPHEEGRGVLEVGTPIVIDIYPRSTKTGYWGDITRTVCLGEPHEELQRLYNTVLEAQELAIAAIRPGIVCKDLHNIAANYFVEQGYKTSGKGTEFEFAEGFVHGLGHGVGQEIHQDPHITRKNKEVLQVGDVITIEPGLYYKHLGGVRIEDLLVVTKDGYQNLTSFPKQFVI